MNEIKKTNSQKSVNLHANHRKRMKDKFLRFGFEPFNDHEILEMLLYYALPQVDTNEIAHELINKFGSFYAVLEADEEDLVNVEGMGQASAHFLQLFWFLQFFIFRCFLNNLILSGMKCTNKNKFF